MDAYIAKMNGKELNQGDVIKDFRGEEHTFMYVTHRKKVYTHAADGFKNEFNESVFPGLIIEVKI